jgi:hypothetical protein
MTTPTQPSPIKGEGIIWEISNIFLLDIDVYRGFGKGCQTLVIPK